MKLTSLGQVARRLIGTVPQPINGLYKNLADLGFAITFAEPDAYGRQQNQDVDDFSYAEVIVPIATETSRN